MQNILAQLGASPSQSRASARSDPDAHCAAGDRTLDSPTPARRPPSTARSQGRDRAGPGPAAESGPPDRLLRLCGLSDGGTAARRLVLCAGRAGPVFKSRHHAVLTGNLNAWAESCGLGLTMRNDSDAARPAPAGLRRPGWAARVAARGVTRRAARARAPSFELAHADSDMLSAPVNRERLPVRVAA